MSVYAVSDLHGMLELYQQVKEFLKPEDKVYCLGDCGDRGPHSWETIKAVLADDQFFYLKGNHEDMLVRTMRDYLGFDHDSSAERLLRSNGGGKTLEGWCAETQEAKEKYYQILSLLPQKVTYTNHFGVEVHLSHAGFSPDIEEKWRDYIWDRDHFYEGWHGEDDEIVVHGHTPFCYMNDAYDVEDPQGEEGDDPIHAVWYCNHHKVCIDAGAFWTGQCILLNLDTFEEHYFYAKEV